MGECPLGEKTWLALKRAKGRSWMETTGRQVLAQYKKVGSRLVWVRPSSRWQQGWVSALVGWGLPGRHGGAQASAGGDITWHNFSATVGTVVHFLVMRLMDSLFLWVGTTLYLHNLAMVMCNS